ncbi:MAG: nucleoid-associated protein [Lachnoclostridium edouardi]|uniref:nucleoid-associated protein n=1 Tax=Lachnoclostridium edouardi TaxID=1926283 RepID=UPI0026DDA229|nr:nucleoid-associated protein [Lachnoclostridium edouardi]MDO4279292.1 nucleoid-associated protein [Lachnoclostridium edouardi]
MLKDDMIMKAGIIHILDSSMAMPVLSDYPIDLGSDLCDFLKAHIEKFTESDDIKNCQFSDLSDIMPIIRDCTPENFVDSSKLLCEKLFQIMNSNIDIPPADVAVMVFSVKSCDYLAILKLNYRTSYTHTTRQLENGNSNEIILHKSLLPTQGQKLSEACVVDLSTGEVMLTEKKYEVNGEKRLYFSELYLQCHAPLSQKSKLDIVTKAVEQINDKYYGKDDAERRMEVKNVIYQELEENGALQVESIGEKVFKDSLEMQEAFSEKMEKYNMTTEVVEPKSQRTIKKFQKQHLTTETGIEITIPMEEYQNPDRVEFITNSDGTISVLIKNIGRLDSK